MDQTHSGPPDTVLPWLEQQYTTPPHVGLGAGREEGGNGEEGGSGEEGEEGENGEEGEDERLLDSTLDVCGPDLTAAPTTTTAPDEGGAGAGSSCREHALVQEEEKEVGVVALSVYVTYWAAVGSLLAPAIFTALFLMQG